MMWLLFVAFLGAGDLRDPFARCTPLKDPFGDSLTCGEMRDPFSKEPEERMKTNDLRIPEELR